VTTELSEALELLFVECVVPHVKAACGVDANVFREERLYW